MSGIARVLALTVRFHRAAKLKFALLCCLVAVGMSVFIVVLELSRVSTQNLDEAIAGDVGEAGTFRVELRSTLGLSHSEMVREVTGALRPMVVRPPHAVVIFPSLDVGCSIQDGPGLVPVLVAYDERGAPTRLPTAGGETLPSFVAAGLPEVCLAGQPLPAEAARLLFGDEERVWGSGLLVAGEYGALAADATTGPVRVGVTAVTGGGVDESTLRATVEQRFAEAADRFGSRVGAVVSVTRVDEGDEIRRASEGVRLVYGVIGWGVLLLGGLGLLVAELIVVRDRTWFFGLVRAVGGRTRFVVGLVVAEVALVLVAGTALAVGVLMAAQPVVSSFATGTFGIDVQLVQGAMVPRLLAGALAVLVLAVAYPAFKATRQDPLDVLERPSV